MAVTEHELECFSQFARERLNKGDVESLAGLVAQWEASREDEETIEDIRQGLADIDAGLGKPVDASFAEVRKRLGAAQ
jgi:hypothetical protein